MLYYFIICCQDLSTIIRTKSLLYILDSLNVWNLITNESTCIASGSSFTVSFSTATVYKPVTDK